MKRIVFILAAMILVGPAAYSQESEQEKNARIEEILTAAADKGRMARFGVGTGFIIGGLIGSVTLFGVCAAIDYSLDGRLFNEPVAGAFYGASGLTALLVCGLGIMQFTMPSEAEQALARWHEKPGEAEGAAREKLLEGEALVRKQAEDARFWRITGGIGAIAFGCLYGGIYFLNIGGMYQDPDTGYMLAIPAGLFVAGGLLLLFPSAEEKAWDAYQKAAGESEDRTGPSGTSGGPDYGTSAQPSPTYSFTMMPTPLGLVADFRVSF